MTFHTKLLLVQNHLPNRFNEIDGFIKIYDGVRYLALFGSGLYDAIYNRIRYYK